MKPTCGVHPPVTNKWNPHQPDGWWICRLSDA
jgi:hypothetical protein